MMCRIFMWSDKWILMSVPVGWLCFRFSGTNVSECFNRIWPYTIIIWTCYLLQVNIRTTACLKMRHFSDITRGHTCTVLTSIFFRNVICLLTRYFVLSVKENKRNPCRMYLRNCVHNHKTNVMVDKLKTNTFSHSWHHCRDNKKDKNSAE